MVTRKKLPGFVDVPNVGSKGWNEKMPPSMRRKLAKKKVYGRQA